MPPSGVPLPPASAALTDSEYVRLASVVMACAGGAGKIRLTGGEPTLHPTLVPLVASLAKLTSGTVGITTNGLVLHRSLPALLAAGLGSVNVSLDSVDRGKFRAMTRRDALPTLLKSLRLCREHTDNIKVNCVVMRGFNDGPGDFEGMLRFGEELDVDVRFIEYMPFSDNGWDGESKYMPYSEMLSAISQTSYALSPLPPTDPHDTSKWHSHPSSPRRVGFIASMSTPFCSSCNRLRITADGSLKVCLFSNSEVSLRDAMRDGVSDAELEAILRGALGGKERRWGGSGELEELRERSKGNRAMTAIGG
ncbi:hypothetical protein TeGR_g14631 [Tetraparma gracilis]|uniref:Radical SAM core domain-containing protein n=1 Tax=Tetraparma gracilis TaxID=2962635 RepID=A0ABQ6M5D4_9STRA|nr:hypothetical protein TeGR_g14631 [Tetraparma gracilis]